MGFGFIIVSLAEMASMYVPFVHRISWVMVNRILRSPASGGEFQWVSEFAPPEQQRFLSYTTGKTSMVCDYFPLG